jgi:hypothetical protein
MRIKLMVMCGLFCFGLASAQDVAPKHEVGLTLGRLASTSRSSASTQLDLGSGTALQANYGYRFFGGRTVALYGEVHFLANPLREVRSQNQALTRDVATIFLTPGLRVKLLPRRQIAPYFALGGGWAVYEQSTTSLDGRPNTAPRSVNRGAVDYGGGVDFRLWRFVGLRAEIRDFYAGSPAYNTTAIRGRQHNVVVGGGILLAFERD